MNYQKIIYFVLISIIIVISSLNVGIFWDNVIFVSKMGAPLFNNGILNWASIPLESDPGHPPFIASVMAFGWKIFGKSLAVSHWMMLPFIFGLIWQLWVFIAYFVKEEKLQIWAFMLVIADPTLLSQFVLVSPEVIQIFFFMMAINGILYNRVYLKILGLAFLGIVSFRGMLLCGGVFISDVLINLFVEKKSLKTYFSKQLIISYLVAATPAILYIIWRITVKGWIMSNPLEIWDNYWAYPSVKEFIINFLKNIIVLGHRFADFGRLILILFVCCTLLLKRRMLFNKEISIAIILFVFSTIVVYSISLFALNPMGHRYFIPSYLSMAILSFLILKEYKYKKTIYTILISSLLLGNLIVYPDKIAQGWDASLAHLPYWNLRKSAINYMDENKIPIAETASFFPNYTTIDNIELNGDLRSFSHFSGKEEYVFYSNVYNLSDEDLDVLNNNYLSLQTFKKRNVRVEIFKIKN